MKEILKKDDIARIISKSLYWEEVSKRSNADEIYRDELFVEIRRIGDGKMLAILAEYAKRSDS